MTTPRRGPRKAQEIFATTLALLAEHGYDGLAIEVVADRSGVNKTTLYRWWPSKDALLAAALRDSNALEFTVPDTGTLRGDLRALIGLIRDLLTRPPSAQLVTAALAAAPRRPELGGVVQAFLADRMARERPVFERAVARGELRADADQVAIMDLLGGAIWFRVLLRSGEAGDRYLDELVDLVLRGGAP
ncbi:TetR/AcrR family transcriptional regulator [Amycolatopsis minnesotensis]|uniref:TetR/AcrR family transcriptional regulator n=1 Tax=Amycolatopsis minnesotensis TaxID=337894 RepID=A0ABP5BAE6_9PSEU